MAAAALDMRAALILATVWEIWSLRKRPRCEAPRHET
jgi:hypothetical protein